MPRRRSTGRSSRSHQARNVPIEPELPQQKWEGVVEAFRDLVTEAEVSGVNPAACIPFTNIRIISNSGVARLKESFSGKCNHDSPTTGMTSGGCLPSVVRLQGVYDSYPLNYWRVKFQEDGLEDSQIDEKLNEKMEENNTWYGIVDGAHRHRALVELMAEDAIKWGGFTWTVMIIKPAPKSQLRAFARNVNEKQKQQYVISPTWYDTLRSFKDEYNELKQCANGACIGTSFRGSCRRNWYNRELRTPGASLSSSATTSTTSAS